MDPNACLRYLRQAVADGEADRALELREALHLWVARGGFEPSDPNWRSA